MGTHRFTKRPDPRASDKVLLLNAAALRRRKALERALARSAAGIGGARPDGPAYDGAAGDARELHDRHARVALMHELEVHQVELQMQNEALVAAHDALETARASYFELFDAAPVAYLSLDRLGTIEQSNAAAASLLGTPGRELARRKLSTFMTDADGDRFHHYRQALFANNARLGCDLQLLTSRGLVPVHLEAKALRGPGGEALNCLCVLFDRSELEFERASTRSHRARTDALLETATDAMIGVDDSGRIESFNEAAVALFGFGEREIVGQDVRVLVPVGAAADGVDLRGYFVPGHTPPAGPLRPPHTELVGVRKNGTRFPFVLGVSQWRDHDRLKSVAIVRDISEHKRDEARIHESEARLSLIAERIDDALVLQERDGRISYASPAYDQIWGCPAPAVGVHGVPWFHAVHPEDRPRVVAEFARLIVGEPISVEHRIVRPDGTVRRIRARFASVGGEHDEALRYVGIAQDVTEQRALEDDLRQAQKMELMGTFVTAIAHDFGNLLQVMMGCATHGLEEAGLSTETASSLQHVLAASRRGAMLVNQLMTFCRKREFHRVPTEVDPLVEQAHGLITRLAGPGVRVTVTAASHALVMADPVQFDQVLMNLAANARDAMPTGGELTITVDSESLAEPRGNLAPGRYVRLTVADTGGGFDPAHVARIFEPFFTTKSPGVGAGLGLSIVATVVKGLGGHIDVDTAPGRGTAFRIWIPSWDGAAPEAPKTACEATFRGQALLVEDEPAVRVVIGRHLAALGFEVSEVQDGASALALVDAHAGRFDIIVSDVGMPGMSGPEFVRLLRDRYPQSRVLFMSGYPASELVDQKMIAPDAHILQKPFTRPELTASVAALLGAADADLRGAVRPWSTPGP